MKKFGMILLVIVILVGFPFTGAKAQPAPPKGLVISQSCILEIENSTDITWEISLNKVKTLGLSIRHTKFEKVIECPSENFSITIKNVRDPAIIFTRRFHISEKTPDNRFVWKLSK